MRYDEKREEVNLYCCIKLSTASAIVYTEDINRAIENK